MWCHLPDAAPVELPAVIVGCYVLDLYCENKACARNNWPDVSEGGGNYNPVQFTAPEHGSQARQAARDAGWKIDAATSRAWCPDHRPA